jgi:hypothetical protein
MNLILGKKVHAITLSYYFIVDMLWALRDGPVYGPYEMDRPVDSRRR